MDTGFFLGTSQQANEFYRSRGSTPPGLTITKKTETQNTRTGTKPEDKLNPDNLEPMSDEELYALKRVRLRHESDTVYMQSDVDFYDYFYKEGESADPLTIAAHQLKRVYMNAEDYFYALEVRDAYIDMLVEEKFDGSMHRFNMAADEGEIYVPPKPFYSKRAKDYDIVSRGIYLIEPIHNPDDDPGEAIWEFVNEWWEMHPDINPGELVFFEDILTDLGMLRELGNEKDGLRSVNTGRMVMSVTDIKKIEETLNSAYSNKSKPMTEDERLFSRTPRRIREEYKKSFHYPVSETLHKYMTGEISDKEARDPNELTYDRRTNRPITVGELEKRELIRQLSELGWDKLSLMRAMNVGTAMERRKMNENLMNKRKLKKGMARALESQKQYDSVTYDHVGIQENEFDPMEELMKYFNKG